MKILRSLILVSFLTFLGCKEEPPVVMATDSVVSTFYFIRHAEKDRSNPEDRDPELTQRGLGRAMHWAEILSEVPMEVVYTTDYLRTSMTAEPISVKQDINKVYYDPSNIDVEQFKQDNYGKNVLVVGHSNTTPQFVNLLLGEEKYGAMDDDDNGSLFIVQMVGDQLSSSRLHFNCNCPE